MNDNIDIQKLADLARIEVDESDADDLKDSISDILSYVGSVNKVAGEAGDPEAGPVRNVLREDGEPHDPDAYRAALLREAPAVDDRGFIIVPPILAR